MRFIAKRTLGKKISEDSNIDEQTIKSKKIIKNIPEENFSGSDKNGQMLKVQHRDSY